MRPKKALLPLEAAILEAGIDLRRHGVRAFHGFQIAKEIQGLTGSRLLTAYGTLYKALGRMEKAGLLESRWEDPLIAAAEERPRRRFYHVTAAGSEAFATLPRSEDGRAMKFGPGQVS